MGFRVSSHPNHSMILWTGRNHFPRAPRLWEGSTNTGFGAPGNTEPLAKGPPAPPLPRVLFPEERAEILSAPTQKWRLLHPMCGNGLSPGQEQCRDTAAPWKHRTSKKEVSVGVRRAPNPALGHSSPLESLLVLLLCPGYSQGHSSAPTVPCQHLTCPHLPRTRR